jgi:hypothetical protein
MRCRPARGSGSALQIVPVPDERAVVPVFEGSVITRPQSARGHLDMAGSHPCLRLIRALAVETHETSLEAHRYLSTDDLREHKKEALRTAA